MPFIVRIPLPTDPSGITCVVRSLRRALRDVRDRAAQDDARWRQVAMAGMATAEGEACVLVRHPMLGAPAVQGVMRRRWPSMTVEPADECMPGFDWRTEDAVSLGLARRGMEPVRIVVMPQRDRHSVRPADPSPWCDPMPLVFWAAGEGLLVVGRQPSASCLLAAAA